MKDDQNLINAIKDIERLKERQDTDGRRILTLEKGHDSWQDFCVRLVLKTGLSLLFIMTLGMCWGFLSPTARELLKGIVK